MMLLSNSLKNNKKTNVLFLALRLQTLVIQSGKTMPCLQNERVRQIHETTEESPEQYTVTKRRDYLKKGATGRLRQDVRTMLLVLVHEVSQLNKSTDFNSMKQKEKTYEEIHSICTRHLSGWFLGGR